MCRFCLAEKNKKKGKNRLLEKWKMITINQSHIHFNQTANRF